MNRTVKRPIEFGFDGALKRAEKLKSDLAATGERHDMTASNGGQNGGENSPSGSTVAGTGQAIEGKAV